MLSLLLIYNKIILYCVMLLTNIIHVLQTLQIETIYNNRYNVSTLIRYAFNYLNMI